MWFFYYLPLVSRPQGSSHANEDEARRHLKAFQVLRKAWFHYNIFPVST